ncbi:hypothetical protein HaLaN_10660 [Haematococcus lacustris]|uniref:Uncharacterized protein n=1 Tax=Haematococcus lacustris TaxID=44745 RepID=A0A699YWF9_HAELA|nr:hypothetical protein HaLaN_10660 [Haematococcus lacustris]
MAFLCRSGSCTFEAYIHVSPQTAPRAHAQLSCINQHRSPGVGESPGGRAVCISACLPAAACDVAQQCPQECPQPSQHRHSCIWCYVDTNPICLCQHHLDIRDAAALHPGLRYFDMHCCLPPLTFCLTPSSVSVFQGLSVTIACHRQGLQHQCKQEQNCITACWALSPASAWHWLHPLNLWCLCAGLTNFAGTAKVVTFAVPIYLGNVGRNHSCRGLSVPGDCHTWPIRRPLTQVTRDETWNIPYTMNTSGCLGCYDTESRTKWCVELHKGAQRRSQAMDARTSSAPTPDWTSGGDCQWGLSLLALDLNAVLTDSAGKFMLSSLEESGKSHAHIACMQTSTCAQPLRHMFGHALARCVQPEW